MILMRENPFQGPLEGVGPKSLDYFGPWNGNQRRKCHLRPKKSRLSGPAPSNGPINGFSRIKISKSKCNIKNRYIGNFMSTSFCNLYSVFYILYSVFYILYSVFCILYSVFCILYSVFCILYLYSVFCILYSVFYILYSVFCILYPVFCTVCCEFACMSIAAAV
jgi:hypothetical protein